MLLAYQRAVSNAICSLENEDPAADTLTEPSDYLTDSDSWIMLPVVQVGSGSLGEHVLVTRSDHLMFVVRMMFVLMVTMLMMYATFAPI